MIIGISGLKGSGKDTAADYLVNNHDFIKISFADALKDGCKAIFGFNDRQLNGDLKEVKDDTWKITPREAMQFVGTDLFRNQIKSLIPWVNDNFWIECTLNKIKKIKNTPDTCNKNIVIADVRFENEAESIKNMDGIIICVKRNGLPHNNMSEHESEKYTNTINHDYLINNDDNIDKLQHRVELIINTIKN